MFVSLSALAIRSVQVAQSDFPDWSCAAVGDGVTDAKPGYLELSTLYFVALVTEKFHSSSSKIILYVDGVCFSLVIGI